MYVHHPTYKRVPIYASQKFKFAIQAEERYCILCSYLICSNTFISLLQREKTDKPQDYCTEMSASYSVFGYGSLAFFHYLDLTRLKTVNVFFDYLYYFEDKDSHAASQCLG